MKLILDKPVLDRVDGKAVSYKPGQVVDFPEAMGEELLSKGAGRDFPQTREEKDAMESAIKHPVPTPAKK